MTIQREWELFHSIIPASSHDYERRRTPYFYRKQAIEWARMARTEYWFPDFKKTCTSLAKNYLRSYREMLARKRQ